MLASYVVVQTFIFLTVDRFRTRLVHDERGQTAAEYLGIIVVVVAIVGAIIGSGLGGKVFDALGKQIDKITAGK